MPDLNDPVQELHGPTGGRVTIRRDGHGIPTITADSTDDGWWGLGYAAAQDRLWQMEYDRRRAAGRWSEVVGIPGVAADTLARRLQLVEAAQGDLKAMDRQTRTTFECYAAGVNMGATSAELPPEYAVAGIGWEPWQAWQSIAAFKVRHVLMGAWQYKLARALMHTRHGPAVFEAFDPVARAGMRLTSPAGSRQRAIGPDDEALLSRARQDVAAAAAELGFLAEVEAGSNAWVISGSRTSTGAPLLANDSHRAADVPNVYWQARLEAPGLSVSGGTFPGIPGFPHFGHNGHVGWAITNAAADAQDLIKETFRHEGDGLQVRTPAGWTGVQIADETIQVRGSDPVSIQCVSTPNGPVVHGDPRQGDALSLRWTATDGPCEQFAVLVKMLHARNVDELLDAQRGWVDPVNNLLCADIDGNIGYLLRGSLPQRRGRAATQLPVPGWQEDSQWVGRIAFEDMPREVNPSIGFIASGNNAVVDSLGEVSVAHAINDFYRIERIHELLEGSTEHDVASMRRVQSDTVSIAARRWSEHLHGRGAFHGEPEQARQALRDWDGDLSSDRPAGLLYACFRRVLAQQQVAAHLDARGQRLLSGTEIPAGGVLLKRWFAQLIWPAEDGSPPAAAMPDTDLEHALAGAWRDASALAGPVPARWRWREHHWLEPRHTLSGSGIGDLPSPTPVSAAGDAETIQAAAYDWPRGNPFTITNTAVYRQILDFRALEESLWVIPGGASGRPGAPHYEDQLRLWGQEQLLPMAGIPLER